MVGAVGGVSVKFQRLRWAKAEERLDALAVTPSHARTAGLDVSSDGGRRTAFQLLSLPGIDFHQLLRPPFQRGTPRIGQAVNAALGAVEPAVKVVLHDLGRVRNIRLQLAHLARTQRQR